MDDEEFEDEAAAASPCLRFDSVRPWAAPGAGVSLSEPGRGPRTAAFTGSTSRADAFTLASNDSAKSRAVPGLAF